MRTAKIIATVQRPTATLALVGKGNVARPRWPIHGIDCIILMFYI